MALTPETLVRHELNGLPVRVVESDDSSREGLSGRVVLETTNTLSVEVRESPEATRDAESSHGHDEFRVVTVPKSGSTFEFAITDEAAGDEKSLGTTSELADTQPGFDTTDTDCAGDGVAYVTVDGSRLLSRPARRTETTGDSPWQ
ncbi:ribonuclease P protein component 1 [Natronobiforma cellulositropha]|uniref:ribonuclease P protein component 1 n=1 Tax=Natronobiforma cellulositropha TaxID=1679076 RepID=UPI0021D56D81|nr:ribonuclease P protein component 1 [Natronobiforma cellulositropha]